MLSSRLLRQSLPRASRAFSSGLVTGRRAIRPAQSIQTQLRPVLWHTRAAFSTSTIRADSDGQVNVELSAKLENELAMEKEMRETDQPPDHIREYMENTEFKIQDTPGQEEVVLTRTFGDEKIKVTFSIDDINNTEDDPDQIQDNALSEELEDTPELPTETQSRGSTKSAINQGQNTSGNMRVTSEDNVLADRKAEDVGDMEGAQEPSFAAHVSVTIERPGKGALQLETVAQDGLIAIDSIYYYKDATHLDPKTSDQEAQAASLYTGPPFTNLDEDLQVLFEKYLDERGINTTMALWVPEYIDYKEQKEYLHWLSNVKKFVD